MKASIPTGVHSRSKRTLPGAPCATRNSRNARRLSFEVKSTSTFRTSRPDLRGLLALQKLWGSPTLSRRVHLRRLKASLLSLTRQSLVSSAVFLVLWAGTSREKPETQGLLLPGSAGRKTSLAIETVSRWLGNGPSRACSADSRTASEISKHSATSRKILVSSGSLRALQHSPLMLLLTRLRIFLLVLLFSVALWRRRAFVRFLV